MELSPFTVKTSRNFVASCVPKEVREQREAAVSLEAAAAGLGAGEATQQEEVQLARGVGQPGGAAGAGYDLSLAINSYSD